MEFSEEEERKECDKTYGTKDVKLTSRGNSGDEEVEDDAADKELVDGISRTTVVVVVHAVGVVDARRGSGGRVGGR